MNKKLKSSIDPSWNFGPEKRIVKLLLMLLRIF